MVAAVIFGWTMDISQINTRLPTHHGSRIVVQSFYCRKITSQQDKCNIKEPHRTPSSGIQFKIHGLLVYMCIYQRWEPLLQVPSNVIGCVLTGTKSAPIRLSRVCFLRNACILNVNCNVFSHMWYWQTNGVLLLVYAQFS